MNSKVVNQEAEGLAKAEAKPVEILLKDISARLEKLEKAVYKPKDNPIQSLPKRNNNTDPGPFPGGSGINNIV